MRKEPSKSEDRGTMEKEKLYYVEVLRVMAIFFVVFNHTRNLGYSLYTETEGGFSYWASLSVSILCKIAVPVFFMISGGLLLGKRETLKQLFSKRILRYVAVILLFTFLQYLRIVRVHPEDGFHLTTWMLYCYTGNIIEPYWFLKSYLSMLLILPFLRLLASVMQKRDYLFLLGIKGVMTLISLICIYTGYTTNISFPFHVDIIFYPLTGYFLMNVLEQDMGHLKTKGLAGLLLAFWALAVFQADAFFRHRGTYVEDFHTVYVWVLAALTVLLAKRIRLRTVAAQKVICAMGSCAFGVYLIEDVVRNQVQRVVAAMVPFFGRFWTGMVFTLLSVLVSMAVIYLVRKIPLVRKLI